jgi:hypothetical protein
MLTLSEAIKTGRLQEFVTVIGPFFLASIRRLATQPQSEGRTLRSSSGDGSSGK